MSRLPLCKLVGGCCSRDKLLSRRCSELVDIHRKNEVEAETYIPDGDASLPLVYETHIIEIEKHTLTPKTTFHSR